MLLLILLLIKQCSILSEDTDPTNIIKTFGESQAEKRRPESDHQQRWFDPKTGKRWWKCAKLMLRIPTYHRGEYTLR